MNKVTDINSGLQTSFRSGPAEDGLFGIFGGRFVAETVSSRAQAA